MKTILLAAAAALALTGAADAAVDRNAKATMVTRGHGHRVIHAPAASLATLYDQNIGDGSYGFFSQALSSYPQYDEYLADDFTVPAGHTWKVKEVDVTGFYYKGSGGPASSVNVLFWKDRGGLPSTKPKIECDNLTPGTGLDTGSFQIALPKSCKVKLKGSDSGGSTYWVTVQANMQGFYSSGYWAWQSNATVTNNVAAGWWSDSALGPPPICVTSWGSLTACTGFTVDLAFALLGKDAI
jgi:hypothetical protein